MRGAGIELEFASIGASTLRSIAAHPVNDPGGVETPDRNTIAFAGRFDCGIGLEDRARVTLHVEPFGERLVEKGAFLNAAVIAHIESQMKVCLRALP